MMLGRVSLVGIYLGLGEWVVGWGVLVTSAIIMWQSKVPLPWPSVGLSTWERILATTGGPKVRLGTKWPSLSTWLL